MASKSIRDKAWRKQLQRRAAATDWQKNWETKLGGFNPDVFEEFTDSERERLGKLGLGPQGVGTQDKYGNVFNALHHGEWQAGDAGHNKWSQLAWEMGIGSVDTKHDLMELAQRAEKLTEKHGDFLTDGMIDGNDMMLWKNEHRTATAPRRTDEEFNNAVNAAIDAREAAAQAEQDAAMPDRVEGSQGYQTGMEQWFQSLLSGVNNTAGTGPSPYVVGGRSTWNPRGGW